MNQDVNGSTSFVGDVEPMLPDGWKPGDDIFADAPLVGEDAPLSDDLKVGDDLSGLLADNEEKADNSVAPTTGENEPAAKPNAGDTAASAPDGEAKANAVAPRLLKLKVNHQEQEVDINQMSDEELIAALQKSRAFDARQEADNKRKFRETYQEQIDAGMTEGVAQMVAAAAANGKTYALTDEEETPPAAPEAALAAQAATSPGRDFQAEVATLKAIYPDFKEMPQSVVDAFNRGAPLYAAYGAYLNSKKSEAVKALQKENQILRQNAASAAQAPVTGVSGGGSVAPEKEDPFIKGFDSPGW